MIVNPSLPAGHPSVATSKKFLPVVRYLDLLPIISLANWWVIIDSERSKACQSQDIPSIRNYIRNYITYPQAVVCLSRSLFFRLFPFAGINLKRVPISLPLKLCYCVLFWKWLISWKGRGLTNQNQPTKNQKSFEVSMEFRFCSHQKPWAMLEPSSNSTVFCARKNVYLVV